MTHQQVDFASIDYLGLLDKVGDLNGLIIVDPYFHPSDLPQLGKIVGKFTILTTDTRVSGVPHFSKIPMKAETRKAAFVEAARPLLILRPRELSM